MGRIHASDAPTIGGAEGMHPTISYKSLPPMLLRWPRSVLFALVVVAAGACSGPTALPTTPMSAAPTVDGALDEWSGRLTRVGDRPVSLAVHPTDSLLYVAVHLQDRALVRSTALHGLVVWVDATGDQDRRYGVQYPLGLRRQAARAPQGSGRPSLRLEDVSLTELEVVRGDTSRRRLPARYSSGLRGDATLDAASLICELAIPVGTAQHGLSSSLRGRVDIGLETPIPEEDVTAQPREQGIPSVTGRSGQQGRRGRQGGRRRQRQKASPEPPALDTWASVTVPGG